MILYHPEYEGLVKEDILLGRPFHDLPLLLARGPLLRGRSILPLLISSASYSPPTLSSARAADILLAWSHRAGVTHDEVHGRWAMNRA
jgi:hypothetical protein